MTATLLPQCICGSTSMTRGTHLNIPTLCCLSCGVVRQDVALDAKGLERWYRDRYHEEFYTHTPQHDRAVAEKRLDVYQLKAGQKLLDIGSGNGAFVAAARARGLDAWGQDLSAQADSDRVYVGELSAIAFPTGDFDVITIHDVLEHVPDPVAFLKEVRRLLKSPGGVLLLDYPRFWHEAGEHHWKLIEHLWMFTGNQLLDLLQRTGFEVDESINPIPSKILVRSWVPEISRVNILVPAGIGDAYWVMTKLRGFMREKGIVEPPNIWVQDAGGPKRTEPYLRTVSFVRAAGYAALRTRHRIWKQAYLCNGPTVYEKPFVEEDIAPWIDWFIAYNGVMRFGQSLSEVDPQWPVEWHHPMHISKEARAYQAHAMSGGPYALVYITDAGMYQKWLQAFTPLQIQEALQIIEKQYGLRIMFMGAEWDRDMTGETLAQRTDGWIDLVGTTTYDQMIGAILGASVVIGYPAGNTIMATALKVPTVLLWHGYFDKRFWTNSCAPDAPYTALDCTGLTVEALVDAVAKLLPTFQPV